VPILDTVYVTRILVRDHRVFGAYGFDIVTGKRYLMREVSSEGKLVD
jgi:succinate dehydrogenase / fumarate reductase flavoprotein subunit